MLQQTTSPDDLLKLITPGIQMDEELIKRIYFYDTEKEGFAEMALVRLKGAGVDDAEEKYRRWHEQHEAEQDEINQSAAEYMQNRQKVKAVCDNGTARPMKEIEPLDVVSAKELSEMVLEPVRVFVENLITQGLTLFVGSPKIGKSWFVLAMAVCVALGIDFLGNKTFQCSVLYLALEDSVNRLQSRLDHVLDGKDAPDNFFLATMSHSLGNGLIEQLEDCCEQNPEIGLIIVDTFQKVRSGGGRENLYSVDYREVGQIKQFADEHKIAIVLVHHTRKSKDPSDTFNNISGTTGISGAADTMIVLDKEERTDETAKLSVTGRDVEMQEFALEFKDFHWHIIGTPEEVEEQRARAEYDQNPVVQTVRKLLDQNAGIWTGSASDLISSSRYFGTPIHDSALQLGRAIGKLSDLLWQYDRIMYQAMPNGSGAKSHRFQYRDNPFEVA